MTERENMLEKYYTDKGREALMARYKTLVAIYANQKTIFPFKHTMWGFPVLEIKTPEELRGRVKELANILMMAYDIATRKIIKVKDYDSIKRSD